MSGNGGNGGRSTVLGRSKNRSPEVVAAVKGTVKESLGYEDSEGVVLVSWAPSDQVRRNPKGFQVR